jgi:protein-disulfide isomerase
MEPHVSHNSAPWLSAPVAIIIAGVIIGVSLIVAFKQPASPAAGGAPAPRAVNVKDVKITADTPFIGNAKAKVTLVVWEDYECPFCGRFEKEVMPTLVKNYVDTGKVKIVFKDYQFLGPTSILAGEWGRAIWKIAPEKYQAWRKTWFDQQPPEHSLAIDAFEKHLVKVTTEVGIDAAAVKADVAANKAAYDAMLSADQAEGSGFGIQGTPGFITGKVAIDGAQPLASFTAAIDPQL